MFVRKYETRRARRLSRRRSASRVSASVLAREDAGRYARSSMSTSHHAVDALGGGSNADASFVFFFFSGRSRAFFRDVVVAEIRSTRRRGARTAALLARLARRRATQRPAPGLERRLERGEVELEIRELRLERRARRKRRRRARVFFFGSSRVRLRVLPGGERRKRVPGDIQPRRGRRVRVHPRVLPARRRRGEERRRRRAPRVRLRPSFFSFSPEQGRARRRRRRRRRQRDDVRRGERDTRVRRGRVCFRVPLALDLVRSFRERLVEQPRRVSGGRLVAARLRFLFVVARTVSRRFRRRRDGSRPSRRGDRE